MIQKIKLLQTEMAQAILNGEYADPAAMQQQVTACQCELCKSIFR
jgi:hypothetical protein